MGENCLDNSFLRSKAKSVILSDDARRRSEELFLKHFGRAL